VSDLNPWDVGDRIQPFHLQAILSGRGVSMSSIEGPPIGIEKVIY
jgi:hypothetical protein